MAAKKISDEVLQKTFDCWKKQNGKTFTVAKELGVSEGTVRFRLKEFKDRNNITADISEPPFWVDDLPDGDLTAEELVDRGVKR